MRRAVLPQLLVALSVVAFCDGCGGGDVTSGDAEPGRATPAAGSARNTSGDDGPSENVARAGPPRRTFTPVTLGGGSGAGTAQEAGGGRDPLATKDGGAAFETLKELQVVLGTWRTTTRKKFDGFNAVGTMSWRWDFLTDKTRPTLVFDAADNPYFQTARLTWLAGEGKFRLTARAERIYKGEYLEQPRNVPDDDNPNKLQRVFKLELTQVEPSDGKDLARVVINQQQNNRYLVELYDRRGMRFMLTDTLASQREGTNFAIVEDDYGEKTCIVSQGLGTIALSHAGRTFYVCCTGCEAAFKEDPERWIARAAEREKE
ncbi:MAG: hypothetical protein KY476_08115 [Planctomycetes bacterium]|nr:hypothetical protein [Planctomycetota bacterium]